MDAIPRFDDTDQENKKNIIKEDYDPSKGHLHFNSDQLHRGRATREIKQMF